MLILMSPDASQAQIEAVSARVRELGVTPHVIPGATQVAVGVTGNKSPLDPGYFRGLAGVANVVPVMQPFKLVSREVKAEDSVIDIGGVAIGGKTIALIGGPCSVESEEQILTTARAVRAAGARFLRGGAFKPRTSPYDFQGLRVDGLKLLALARAETGLKIVTEVKDTQTLDAVAQVADVLQIGARNMQNFSLLEAVGELRKPVLLKRGPSATLKEFLLAAEYIFARGNQQIILCERGIRTFETMTRNTLDLNAVPVLKQLTHLPVVIDPSHGTGIRAAVPAMARAAIAAGADGLLVECHPDPERALSDGDQSLTLPDFAEMARQIQRVAEAVGRSL